ncbi:MAG: DNA processing protein DprA [Fimbriimonadales bacterium]|nr:MAG: DNA processing protein DprA [Fimbriimonadales bacterium]
MSQEELRAWLKLLSLEFSANKLRALLERFGDPEGVFGARAESLREVAGMREADVAAIERIAQTPIELPELLEWGEAQLLIAGVSDAYPRPLEILPDPPPALFVWGELHERDRFAVGVVGTRKPSAYGRMVAERFTRDLCEAGLTIVSGGALGVDTVAHRTAVEAGGRTVAILGSGLGNLYPSENRALFRRIAETGGAVVSEYAWNAAPDAWRFPVRNRLIAAWGLGTLVVEAPESSGALITARLAAEYGREVFAVPGSIDNLKSKGCHALIKDGAALADRADDILNNLKIQTEPRQQTPNLPLLTETQEKLLAVLDLEPRHLDALARQLGMPVHTVQAELTMLEMHGLARRMPGGAFVRVL